MKNRSIRVSEDLIYSLELIAAQEDRTVSDCIRQAIKQYTAKMLS